MAALSGKVARIKLASQTASSSTNEAATLNADGVTLTIDASSKRHWNRGNTTGLKVYGMSSSTAAVVASSNYSVDWAAGVVTFATARSTAVTYTLDVPYHTASYLGLSRGWSLEAETDMLDVTCFGTGTGTPQWRSFKPGLSGARVTLQRLLDDSTGRDFYDLENAEADLILELIPSTGAGGYQCYGWVESDGYESPIEGLGAETVTVRVDGPLSYTTSL